MRTLLLRIELSKDDLKSSCMKKCEKYVNSYEKCADPEAVAGLSRDTLYETGAF